ncbi:dual specificity protein phosphatase 19-like [Lingula anatina]|uniref:Dual specificity protein phosphatase 19-like n=1 Tax=Lingula anatina TaxID=7574 RepID=A0A1S3IV07_LINAN|nr:dual specificity protein phosphatase 19-like [Lingula anatina]XP_013407569.1 dual specificity protein phosphatase 19-like [Lingula anatina]XP_013407570.1 dual specificity protein phosphatase 19-like [Lingula anatina]|eukprot:XP_013402035.1 dual specificity protein phosphatase 19-like [Lingula anatina]
MSLLSDIEGFSKSKLKPVPTKVTTVDGRLLQEDKDSHGRTVVTVLDKGKLGFVGDTKRDLQVAEILPGVVMGSQDVAQDLELLLQHKVTHILNLAYMVENQFPDQFQYLRLNILDLPETDITDFFDEAFSFIDRGRQEGCVLVHCNAGVSRSAAMVIGYLIKTEGLTFEEAFDHVREQRASIRPNDGFTIQLKHYELSLAKNLEK